MDNTTKATNDVFPNFEGFLICFLLMQEFTLNNNDDCDHDKNNEFETSIRSQEFQHRQPGGHEAPLFQNAIGTIVFKQFLHIELQFLSVVL